jgi:hypothetical protein
LLGIVKSKVAVNSVVLFKIVLMHPFPPRPGYPDPELENAAQVDRPTSAMLLEE